LTVFAFLAAFGIVAAVRAGPIRQRLKHDPRQSSGHQARVGEWTPEKASAQFIVDVRGIRGINVVLQPPSPSWADLYLRFINLTPIWFDVTRIHAELAIAHTPVDERDSLETYRVDPYSAFPRFAYEFQGMDDRQVYVRFPIESGLASYLKEQLAKYATSFDVQLTVSVYGDCETGKFERRNLRFEIPGPAAGLVKGQ
jgi:hypothetical protein